MTSTRFIQMNTHHLNEWCMGYSHALKNSHEEIWSCEKNTPAYLLPALTSLADISSPIKPFLRADGSSVKYRTKCRPTIEKLQPFQRLLFRDKNYILKGKQKICDLFGYIKGRLNTARKIISHCFIALSTLAFRYPYQEEPVKPELQQHLRWATRRVTINT